MSGAFSTEKAAARCGREFSGTSAAAMASCSVSDRAMARGAVSCRARSISTPATTSSLPVRSTPDSRSSRSCRSASLAEASSVAVSASVYSVAPRARPLGSTSAWSEMKTSARTSWAIDTRRSSGTKLSSSRVRITRVSPRRIRVSCTARARSSIRVFSIRLPRTAPGSMPPWPGSITTVRMPSSPCGGAVSAGTGRSHCGSRGAPARSAKLLASV